MKHTIDNLPCAGKIFVGNDEVNQVVSFDDETREIEFLPCLWGKPVVTWSEPEPDFVVSSFKPRDTDQCKFVGEDGKTVITF